jgi:hypothetical protein
LYWYLVNKIDNNNSNAESYYPVSPALISLRKISENVENMLFFFEENASFLFSSKLFEVFLKINE